MNQSRWPRLVSTLSIFSWRPPLVTALAPLRSRSRSLTRATSASTSYQSISPPCNFFLMVSLALSPLPSIHLRPARCFARSCYPSSRITKRPLQSSGKQEQTPFPERRRWSKHAMLWSHTCMPAHTNKTISTHRNNIHSADICGWPNTEETLVHSLF